MSSEVCPFCGKTYKRLKSHLPHCKAAASSKTPPTKHDVTVNQTTLSSQLAALLSKPTAKSTQTLSITANPLSKKSKKMSVVSSAPPNASSSSESSSLSSASVLPSTKKKKPKLSEQIKTANTPSSTTMSLTSSPSLPLSPTTSKPKKQSLRALIEAAKSKQVSKGSLKGSRSASEDLTLGSTPVVAGPFSSRITAVTKTNPDEDSIKDDAHPAFQSTDTKPKAASKMKVSKTKKAAQSLSKTKDTSSSLDSKVNETTSARAHDDFLVDNDGEVEDLYVNKMLLKSGSGHLARITLQDVKATLGRANGTRQSSRPSILSQIETTDDRSSKNRLGTSLSPVPLPTGNQDSCLVTTKALSDQPPCNTSQHTELQSVKRQSSKSEQATLLPLQQLELTSPAAPLLSGHLSSLMSKATSPPHTVSMNEGLKVTGLLTISPSLTKLSSPLLAARVETLRADDGLKSQLEVRKQHAADNGTKVGSLTQRSLGQVRLRELPEWLACKTPSHPKDVVEMVQRGWQWYYKRYIDVKKGGVGGVGMLLAGYCVLGYIWSYPHIKRDRWRKYH
ncbi:hypothetical protein EPR50_G00211890 [Perca flavescens]|uniref:Uncharacterized protein n=1 Tax=Perca flavescens TaxID=8167 RepID=A0A484C9Y6_PERFV|nr:uncharacterized protein C17orf80 homolog isoform X1 [Perca flavescens]TDG97823.1 hypothetical protein EPR50_G00211890 [Perca flavescens]